MKKRRSDIPMRTGMVERRRFKTYWNIGYWVRGFKDSRVQGVK
jgi:hypothetical protein